MAVLDPRLFPLLETLAGTGLGWLAREVVAGALAGHVPEEPRELLLLAREAVLRPRQDEWKPGYPEVEDVLPEPFSGDEQIRWAGTHVLARLTDAIAMMGASMEAVDSVVEKEGAAGFRRKAPVATSLVLADGEERVETSEADLARAIVGLDALRSALETWLAEAGEGGQLA